MRTPDFFLVGAPKCGTTAMYHFLKQHPEIFVPSRKELHYFGSDLQASYFVRDRERYLRYFEESDQEKRAGEASVWYLYSQNAAHEIQEFCPDASIIIMLRNPVDVMHSYHSQRLFNGTEDIGDFEQALEAEEDRRSGRRLPSNPDVLHGLQYRAIARFSIQIERYLKEFDRDRIHIVIHDDFQQDPAAVYRQLVDFLQVSDQFQPVFSSVNPNKKVRSRLIRRIVKSPPMAMRKIARSILTLKWRQKVKRSIKRINTSVVKRAPMKQETRMRLQQEFAEEVKRLGEIVGRDLSRWTMD